MGGRKTVELFYDVVSPYSWLAFEVLCRYRTHWNLDLQLKPLLLGGIIKALGHKSPVIVHKNKADYMNNDIARSRKYFDVPLRIPSDIMHVMFANGSLKPQRFITAIDMVDSSKTENISRELWMRIWSRDEDITQDDSLKSAGQRAGLSDKEISDALFKMTTHPVKERLKAYTDRAVQLKAFGAPYIVAHVNGKEEIVFGSDRFPILAQILGEEWKGPVPKETHYKL